MALDLTRSAEAFERAKKCIPGGVNSPVRSFRGVGGTPPFIASAHGSHVTDIDGNTYIDYVGSWGPMIVGHANLQVLDAIKDASLRGTSYGAPTELETEMAEKIRELVPSMQLVRMTNSGTEATMSVLRLARAYTGRKKIIKFIGCYHGHHDSLLVKAGSGMATLGVPDSPGVPTETAENTISLPYNDIEAVKAAFEQYPNEIAAAIIEPIAGNMGLVLPKSGYLRELRRVTEANGALLIFDEVMCGFRASLGGAQYVYSVRPDLTCLGKVIGGGLPVGAYGGREDIMSMISPAGPVYQAGTLSGNPLAMAAGLETLKIISEDPELPHQPDFTQKLTVKTRQLCGGFMEAAKAAGLTLQFHQAGSMFCTFFTDKPVTDYASAATSDTEAYRIFFHSMLEQGIYMAPSQFETAFVSSAHTQEDIDKTIEASKVAFAKVAEYMASK
ncbi:MAG: glutamate-1-semialdehyde 2,1-aminomutase [Selenomonadales bacterium]|nr:glutamate-1-semialdehyde 2,1-aminomutase [Selenomonadales bacterium]